MAHRRGQSYKREKQVKREADDDDYEDKSQRKRGKKKTVIKKEEDASTRAVKRERSPNARIKRQVKREPSEEEEEEQKAPIRSRVAGRKQTMRMQQTRCPLSFTCTTGRLVFGQLFSLLPDIEEPWSLRDALPGQYLVDYVFVDDAPTAYLVWHESVEDNAMLIGLIDSGLTQLVRDDCPYSVVDAGRYWYESCTRDDLDKLLPVEAEDDVPFSEGFSVFDESLAGPVCQYASSRRRAAAEMEHKDILLKDDDAQALGCHLGFTVYDYPYLWVFLNAERKICGFYYNFDYSRIIWTIGVEQSTIRIGSNPPLQLTDPDENDLYCPDEDEPEPLTPDSEVCMQILLIREFRPDSLFAKLPRDVIRLICEHVFAMDDVDDREINDLNADEFDIENPAVVIKREEQEEEEEVEGNFQNE